MVAQAKQAPYEAASRKLKEMIEENPAAEDAARSAARFEGDKLMHIIVEDPLTGKKAFVTNSEVRSDYPQFADKIRKLVVYVAKNRIH